MTQTRSDRRGGYGPAWLWSAGLTCALIAIAVSQLYRPWGFQSERGGAEGHQGWVFVWIATGQSRGEWGGDYGIGWRPSFPELLADAAKFQWSWIPSFHSGEYWANTNRSRFGGLVFPAYQIHLPLYSPILIGLLISGLLGVRTWRRRGDQGRTGMCRSCGYNLTGNTSGRCPECGAEILKPKAAGANEAGGGNATDV